MQVGLYNGSKMVVVAGKVHSNYYTYVKTVVTFITFLLLWFHVLD